MKWKKEGDVYRLIDAEGWTRAFLYREWRAYYAVSPLGVSDMPIVESFGSDKRQLMRDTICRLRKALSA